jgi:hypothetical protein
MLQQLLDYCFAVVCFIVKFAAYLLTIFCLRDKLERFAVGYRLLRFLNPQRFPLCDRESFAQLVFCFAFPFTLF